MSRLYFVPISGTVTNAGGNNDLCSLTPADDKPIRIEGIELAQSSEVSDAQEENLNLQILHMTATVSAPTGGASITARKPNSDPVNGLTWGFTARERDTGVATTTGATFIAFNTAWNVRSTPYEKYWPDPDEFLPEAIQTEYLILRMLSTPADDFTFEGGLWVREWGH